MFHFMCNEYRIYKSLLAFGIKSPKIKTKTTTHELFSIIVIFEIHYNSMSQALNRFTKSQHDNHESSSK